MPWKKPQNMNSHKFVTFTHLAGQWCVNNTISFSNTCIKKKMNFFL